MSKKSCTSVYSELLDIGLMIIQGPTGFWDDADFDSDFFNGGGPSTFNSYEVNLLKTMCFLEKECNG